MFRRWIALAAGLLTAPSAFAETPVRFQWQPGQVLTYTVRQTTTVTETTLEEGTNKPATGVTTTTLALTKRWAVKAVDPAGVATLEMSIARMRQEIVRPGPADKAGQPTADRTVLDTATPEGAQQAAQYLDKPIVTAKVDALGRVVEATAAAGSADRLRAELSFRLALPESRPAAGGTWDRPFVIKLDPPLGTGETYDAAQTYTLKGEADGVLTVGVATALTAAPKDPAEMPALVPLLWAGEAYFDRAGGRYAGAKLAVKQEVAGHQGEGTKFVYESQYTEELAK